MYIKTNEIGNKLTLFVLFYYMISYVLSYSFGFNKMILYLADIFNIALFIIALLHNRGKSGFKKVYLIMILYIFLGIFSNLVNFESKFLLIWGLRNSARFFTFFYCCVTFLTRKDIEFIFKVIKYLFYLSVPLCLYQRFIVKYGAGVILSDQVGGIFFTHSGCNAPLHVIILLYSIYIILKYFAGKVKFMDFLITTILSLAMAVLAELKIYVVEYVVIVVLAAIFSKVSIKSVIKIFILLIMLSISISYFVLINGGNNDYSNNFTLKGILDYATNEKGYTGSGDLNRLTGILTVRNTNFKNDSFKRLFGVGLGNSEYTLSFQSKYYLQNKISNYYYLQDVWIYVETGFIGLLLFLLIFVNVYKESKYIKVSFYSNYGKIITAISIILLIYNISFRMESAGFLLYLILAMPYIIRKDELDEVNS